MAQTVGFGLSQINPWENLLKEVFESFEEDVIEAVITRFRDYADDYEDAMSFDDIEEGEDDGFDLQKRFYHVLNKGNDKLRSAKYLKNIMRIENLHYDGEPMEARVIKVIDQLKEQQRQGEVKANEIFVGRDRDIQLILGLLGIQSALTTELSNADKVFIRKQSPRVKGVYLSGIGGQGKTSLARKVCDNLSQAHEPWESIMVSLRSRKDVEEVFQAVLSRLGVLLSIQATDRDTLEKLLLQFTRSTEKNILICLDDCDAIDGNSMKEIGNFFVKMRESHKVKFLLTSRTKFDEKGKEGKYEVKLGGNLVELELDSLSDDEAIDLLRRCSGLGIEALDDERAHHIVTCCSLSPLAVTMVAQMLKEGGYTSQELLFHLKKDEKHATKAMQIHNRVAEVFDNLKLNPELEASVVHLSVFQSSKFDLKSARRILNLDNSEKEKMAAKDVLQRLHDYHFLEVSTKEKQNRLVLDALITVGEGKCSIEYSIHPLVYRFIAERLKEGLYKNLSSYFNEAVPRFVDWMESKTARIYRMLSTKCKKGIAAMEENKVHILQYYDFMLDEKVKHLLPKYPKSVKCKFVLIKKNISDMTDLILHDAKKRRLFLSEAKRAADCRCDAMEIFWKVETADVLSTCHQKPDLGLEDLNKLAAGRFAALRNLHDQPDYPPLIMALYHKVKGQALWKLLKHDEAMQHLCLAEHFYDIRDDHGDLILRPVESYSVLKAKLQKSKGLLLLDLKKLDEAEAALQNAYNLLEKQVYVKNEDSQNAVRVKELKKLCIQIPEFFTHLGKIQIEKACLEKDTDIKNRLLNKALELLNVGLDLDKQLHIDRLDDFAAKMKLCADVYIEQGLYDEAERYSKSAERQRRHCLQLPHINVTESVYQLGKIYILKGNKKHGKHYLRCAEDWFGELESDHLINGSIPTVNHPLYASIKRDHLELYKKLDDKKKLKKLEQFYMDIETGKYNTTINKFKEQFQNMMYTPEEFLDQIYGGGGQQFGDIDNLMIQVEPEEFEGAGRDRADSGKGGSSIDSSLSSMSEGGSLTDGVNRMNIQKSLSLEDEVFQQVPGDQKRNIKRQKKVSGD